MIQQRLTNSMWSTTGRVLLMTLLKKWVSLPWQPMRYHHAATPSPPGSDQWAASCQANNPQQCWNGCGREENAKCATSSGDWHRASCLQAPWRFASFYHCHSFSSSLSFLAFSFVSPCFTPTILPVCGGSAWSGYYPTLLLWYWSASSFPLLLFFIAHCIDSTSPSEPAS